MFKRFKKKIVDEQLNEVKQKLLISLLEYSPEDPEYEKIVSSLERIHALQAQSRAKVSPDVIAAGLFNLLIAIAIILYEQKHVWVSKASSLIKRMG